MALLLNNRSFKDIPLGIILYSENQFKNLIVFFFKDGTSSFFFTFFIAKLLFLFFSNSSQTTPVTSDFPNGTMAEKRVAARDTGLVITEEGIIDELFLDFDFGRRYQVVNFFASETDGVGEFGVKLDFNNVLIRPKRSTLKSRSEVSLEREFKFKHSNIEWNGIPIMSANMDTTGTFEVYNVLSKYNIFLNK